MVNIKNFDSIYLKNYIDQYNKLHHNNEIVDYIGATICSSNSSYSVLQIQPKADLIVDPESGILSNDVQYETKINEFINRALYSGNTYGLVLSPEYSIPLSSIDRLLEKNKDIKYGTLFCLCCQSVTQTAFENFLNKIGDFQGVEVINDAFEHLSPQNLVCCLMYVLKVRFFIQDGDPFNITFVVPQFKTFPMKDIGMEFETQSLACGKIVIEFGKEDELKFISIICADVLNFELINRIKSKVDRNRVFIFNPQLNKKPQNDHFRFMRNMLINFSGTQDIRILTLNWAVETKFLLSGNRVVEAIDTSWSSLYEKYDENNFETYMSVVNGNTKSGVNFAHDHHIAMFFMSSKEHIIDMNIARSISGLYPRDTQTTIPLKVSKCCVFDYETNKFIESENNCTDMIDNFFFDNREFLGLIDCSKCAGICSMDKINKFMSLLTNKKMHKEYEIINDGKISSVTSKHYKSEYSREKIYLCKRVLNKMRNKEVTKKFISQNSRFEYVIDKDNPVFNTVYYCNERKQLCRVMYLKYKTLKEVEKIYRQMSLQHPEFCENFLIYYEDENGVHLYEDNVKTEILDRNRPNSAILAGGNLYENK